MKSFYVVNLDRKRIFIVLGFAMILFSSAFFIGTLTKSESSYQKDLNALQNGNSKEETFNEGRQFEAQKLTNQKNSQNGNQNNENSSALLGSIESNNANKSSQEIGIEEDPLVYSPKKENQNSFRNTSSSENNIEKNLKKNIKEKSLKKKKLSDDEIEKPETTKTKKEFFTVQVGKFNKKEEAIALQKKLKKKGIEARVDKGSKSYFVHVGKAKSSESLESTVGKIKTKFSKIEKDVVIVKRKLS